MTAPLPPWARRRGDGSWLLDLHVQPGAADTRVMGLHGDRLRIRVAAPAVGGRANAALERYVASRLGLRPRQVQVVSGATGRAKTVRVEGAGDVDPRVLVDGPD